MHFEGKYFSFRGIRTRNFFEKHFEKQHKKFFFEKLRVQILSFPQTFYAKLPMSGFEPATFITKIT